MDKIRITCLLNPVSGQTVYCDIPAKGTLYDHVDVPDGVLVQVNGVPYENQDLSPGDAVIIVVPPQGGTEGRKEIARSVMVLAAQVGAAYLTAGLSTWAQIGINAAVTVGARLGANALIQYPQESAQINEQEKFTRLGGITGSRNQIMPYGTVPRIYGKRKIFPPMSARPYTEIVGNQQYMRLLFNLGSGPLHLSDPKIGDTSIGYFNSTNQYVPNNNFEGIQIDVGESPSLYASSVNEVSPGANYDIDPEEGFVGPISHTRTTSPDTEEISVDVTFPMGLFAIGEDGNTKGLWMHWRFEYSPVGQNNWTMITPSNIVDRVNFGEWAPTYSGWRSLGNKRETWRGGISWKVPKGQYDVRVTRVNESMTSHQVTQRFENAVWSALRSITHETPTRLDGTVQLAMRVKATDQVNGVLDNFSVVAESRLANYTGSSWNVPTFNPLNGSGTGGIVTSNPAWILADILCGSDNARAIPYSSLDGASFASFASNCDSEGRMCDIIMDAQRTVLQSLSVVGSTGRGSIAWNDGKYKVIQDTEESVPVQHFTPRNSWGFSSTRVFADLPHAFRVQFVNPEADWQTDEAIVYDDGYSEDGTNCRFPGPGGSCREATKFDLIDLEGVTDWEHAWKEGRYRLAEARLRPEVYTLNADIESIVCQRGDYVLVSHDVPLWGGGAGRITNISGNTVTLDEVVTMESGNNYVIRVRNSLGGSYLKTVSFQAGTHSEITVNNTANIAVGDLFMFGETNRESTPCKVLSVEPQDNLSARLTLIDAAPEIYEADQGPIPDFNSNITRPPVDTGAPMPPDPTITGVRSDINVLNRGAGGTPELRISVSYTLGKGNPTEFIDARLRKADDDGWIGSSTVNGSDGSVSLYNIEPLETYIVAIRGRNGGTAGNWVEADPHVAGEGITIPFWMRFLAIGELAEDVEDESRTEIQVQTRSVVRGGFEYLIINPDELSIEDPDAGVYPIVVERTDEEGNPVDPDDPEYENAITTYDPGLFDLLIQEQRINAPAGSPIFSSPGQETASIEFYEEQTIGLSRAVAGDSIGFLAVEIGSEGMPSPAEYTTLSLKEIPGDLELKDGQLLKLVSPKGHQESVNVNGDQVITQGEDSIAIQPKTFRHHYPPELSYVKESGYAISSRLNFVIKASEGNFQSIAEIATHVNLGGGEAYSALQLRSGIQTNEQGIATNVESIAQLSAHVNLGGGQAFSAVALESRIGVNEQGIANNIQSIANMGTAITDLEADGRTVIRSVSEPPKQGGRPSGEDLKPGDLWLDSSIISAETPIPKNELHVWTGTDWVPSDEQFRNTQSGFTAFSQKVEAEYFSKAIMYADDDGDLAFVSVESGSTPTVRIQGKYLEVDANTTFKGDVEIKGKLTATNWGGGGITEDGGIEMASSIGAVTSWQDVARAVKWKNEASGPGIYTGFIYSYFEYADQTDPEDSVLHLTAGLLEGDHTTRRGAGKIYLSAETHVTHNKEFYYKGQTLDQRFASGASSWADITGKPFNTIGSNLQVSSGALRVHSSSASNWDTAYNQRGSQIAGAGLTWSGGNLNVSLAVQNIPNLPVSKITSGVFAVNRGGTGRNSFQSDLLIFGNGTGGLSTVSAIRRDGNNIRANNFILN